MGKKRTPGLQKRQGIWRVDKVVLGKRLCGSTGTGDLEEAERCLERMVKERRDAVLHGVRPRRTFSQALAEHCERRGWTEDVRYHCQILDDAVGQVDLADMHMGVFQKLIRDRMEAGKKKKTINLTLAMARVVLNQAASDFIDENGLTWLQHAPKIKLLPVDDAAKPYPLSWEEERELFSLMPGHYQRPCLYDVNTGLREDLICGLRWVWEHQVPELGRSVFLIPGDARGVKNGEDWLVVHNRIAQSVIESVRGQDPEYVFIWKRRVRNDAGELVEVSSPLKSLTNTAWQTAWKQVESLPQDASKWRKGVHNLRHTFGHRLRAVGVSNETRHALLHHKTGDMTTHYSVPAIAELVAAVDRLCEAKDTKTTVLRLVAHAKVTHGK